MSKPILIGLAIAITFAGSTVAYWTWRNRIHSKLAAVSHTNQTDWSKPSPTPTPAASSQGSTSVTSKSTSTTTVNGQTTTTIAPVNVDITADDNSASQTSVNVTKGAKVTITFHVAPDDAYGGGLDFRSSDPSLTTGPVASGHSATKTFTAAGTVTWKPYWPNTNTLKPYTITVNAS